MKEKLEAELRKFEGFSKDEIAKGLDFFEHKSFRKDDLLIEAGKTCDWIAFVCSGIVRNYCISSKWDEVTYCLTFPNKFITAYSSFISKVETMENIHAITDLEVLMIGRKGFTELVNSSENWLRFSKHFSEQSYLLMEERLLALQMETAENRYRKLMANYPEFLQNIPLKYISSYLGITDRHLSRLRKMTTE
ncbi:Crp/Fnr family transcriptional regulator [Algoriphagus vanfongensis]|uniref:Crp/Fnr family transcriptional regulator n=1 Tax=Algoriphagus vanfongensis TaxID=426371 RepID=UPI0004051D72|nr:cyclic nucleotide-binding domain-containing protein [Algoriphagus vanfongensis]